jgi:non-homologous end joining protein Ku
MGQELFAVIRDAMHREGVIGLARGRRNIENGDRQQLFTETDAAG